MTDEELERRFSYHAPKGDQAERYQDIRGYAFKLAQFIDKHTPESREKSLAITHLEECIFWSNAAIARNE